MLLGLRVSLVLILRIHTFVCITAEVVAIFDDLAFFAFFVLFLSRLTLLALKLGSVT